MKVMRFLFPGSIVLFVYIYIYNRTLCKCLDFDDLNLDNVPFN